MIDNVWLYLLLLCSPFTDKFAKWYATSYKWLKTGLDAQIQSKPNLSYPIIFCHQLLNPHVILNP